MALAAVAWRAGLPGRGRPPEPGVGVVLRGFQEVRVEADGRLTPRVLGREPSIDLCLQTATTRDTSQWEARLFLPGHDEQPPPLAPPSLRVASTLCFERSLPREMRAAGETALCGEVCDRFDDRCFDLPCRRFLYQEDDNALREAKRARTELLASTLEVGRLVAGLDRLIERSAELPFERLRLQLVAVYQLRREGTPETLAEARRRLAELPAWLSQPEASRWAAQAALERARLELAEGQFRAAWRHFGEAERRFLDVANRHRITAVMGQATILARVGALREAIGRLRPAIHECEQIDCNAYLILEARNLLAWLVQLDPESSPGELDAVVEELSESFANGGPADQGALERANLLVNLAYVRHLQGKDPGPELERAAGFLESSPVGTGRARLLEGWSSLVEAMAALDDGEAARALEHCSGVARTQLQAAAADTEARRLAAWALSCSGRAHRLLGELDLAAAAFERALLLHEHASPAELGQTIVLGPGQRADDYYRAARVEAERGAAEKSWELLVRLDHLTAGEEELRRCRERLDPAARRAQRAHEARIHRLLAELLTLDRPASGLRQRQRQPLRLELKQELQELWREPPGCPRLPPPAPDSELRFRALALPDEALLLARDASGRVRLARRHPIDRGELRRSVEEIRQALVDRRLDDDALRHLLGPLAHALVPPDPGRLEALTPFALHGLLQEVPLAALPLDPRAAGGARWLGELTTVVLRPAAAARVAAVAAGGGSRPLFVVDPGEDLPSGRELLEFYRSTFPEAGFLYGERATVAALRGALGGSSWLHTDIHGRYDPAFPELSRLELADRPMTFFELAELPMPRRFANLSGCQTGRWPATADSGRFGLAGLFARRGVRWVIATRADLPDRLAVDFNRAFYRALSSSRELPSAYARAIDEIRRTHPAVAWSSLFLLGAPPAAAGTDEKTPSPESQSRAPGTPTKVEGET